MLIFKDTAGNQYRLSNCNNYNCKNNGKALLLSSYIMGCPECSFALVFMEKAEVVK